MVVLWGDQEAARGKPSRDNGQKSGGWGWSVWYITGSPMYAILIIFSPSIVYIHRGWVYMSSGPLELIINKHYTIPVNTPGSLSLHCPRAGCC